MLLLIISNPTITSATATPNNDYYNNHRSVQRNPYVRTSPPAITDGTPSLRRRRIQDQITDPVPNHESSSNNVVETTIMVSNLTNNSTTNRGLDLKFSLWHETFTAVNIADHNDVIQRVLTAIEVMLCEDTDITLISSPSGAVAPLTR